MFPPEPADEPLRSAVNPWGRRLPEALGEVLGASPLGLTELREDAGLQVASELLAAARSRQVTNLGWVLMFASQQEAPGEVAKMTIEPSWLQCFLRFSGDATSDLIRETWARLLLKELEEPGAVAPRTLHFFHVMEPWELEAYLEYLAFAFAFESGWRFMFAGDLARRELWSYGREIDLTQRWIDIGLISSELTSLVVRNSSGLRIRYGQKAWEVRPVLSSESGSPIAYRKLTAIGQQIADALLPKTFNGYARNLLKALETQDQVRFEMLPDEAVAVKS